MKLFLCKFPSWLFLPLSSAVKYGGQSVFDFDSTNVSHFQYQDPFIVANMSAQPGK